MEKLKNKKLLGLVGVIALIASVFLPYIKFSFWGFEETFYIWNYSYGKVFFVAAILNAIIVLKENIENINQNIFNNSLGKSIDKLNDSKLYFVPTVIVGGLALYTYYKLNLGLDGSSEYLKYGIGFYLLLIGMVALVVREILIFKEKKLGFSQSVSQVIQTSQQIIHPTQQGVQSVQQAYEPVAPQPINFENQNQKFCPQCGKKTEINDITCSMCGNKF